MMETMIQTPKGVTHAIRYGNLTLCGHTIEKSIFVKAEEASCKACARIMNLPSEEPTEKRCYVCEETKPIEEFYYDSTFDRHSSRCRTCMSRYNSELRKAKREGKKLSLKEFKERRLYGRPAEPRGRRARA